MAFKRTDPALYREVTRAAMLGLVVNFCLGTVKLAGGLVSGSVALVSDALDSLGDVLTSIVVLVGLRGPRKPDEEHPYGHTRAETVAASNVALLIVVSALYLGWQAIARSAHPGKNPSVDSVDRGGECRHQRGTVPLQDPGRQASGVASHHCQRLGPSQRRIKHFGGVDCLGPIALGRSRPCVATIPSPHCLSWPRSSGLASCFSGVRPAS